MKNIFVWRQPDRENWQIAFQPASKTDAEELIQFLTELGLKHSSRLERLLSMVLGSANDEIISAVLQGPAGRCTFLMHKRSDLISLSWRGSFDGEELASLILSNVGVNEGSTAKNSDLS